MQGINKLWLQFACYSVFLGISLGLQVVRPDLFALLCTPLPAGDFLNPATHLDVPLNSPILPHPKTAK